jgi:taurine dioxygenase
MSITVSPFAAGLGADISGIDIREALSAADRDAIRAAWLANLLLRFRDQPMTDEQHMAFTRQFGELEFNPAALIAKQYGVETQTAGRKREVPPEISVISNIVEDGRAIGGLGDGEAFWHTDSSFVDVPRQRACCARSKCRRQVPAGRPRSLTAIAPTTRCPSKRRNGSRG